MRNIRCDCADVERAGNRFALVVGNFVDTLVFTKFSAQDIPLRLSDHRLSEELRIKREF
jgi:hypothetical protein